MKNILEKHVLSIICSVFDAYSAVLFLPVEDRGEGEGEQYRLVASFSLGDGIAEGSAVQPGSLVAWIISNDRPVIVPNFDRRQSKLGYYLEGEESGIKAFVGCPVPTGGALCMDSKRQYSFTDKDYKILQMFAELITRQQNDRGAAEPLGGDISRYFAQLCVIQELRFGHKRWPQFIQNYLKTVAEATGFEYCAFASMARSGETYCLECESTPLLLQAGEMLEFNMNSGLVGWVFNNGQPIINGGTDDGPPHLLFAKMPELPDFQAVICMPVVVNKSTRCVLCLAHTRPRDLDEALRSFVRLAVDHLALFLENLYLKTRLRNMLPRAQVHTSGSRMYDPDNAPHPPADDD